MVVNADVAGAVMGINSALRDGRCVVLGMDGRGVLATAAAEAVVALVARNGARRRRAGAGADGDFPHATAIDDKPDPRGHNDIAGGVVRRLLDDKIRLRIGGLLLVEDDRLAVLENEVAILASGWNLKPVGSDGVIVVELDGVVGVPHLVGVSLRHCLTADMLHKRPRGLTRPLR